MLHPLVKVRMSIDLHFLRILRKHIMLSPFNLFASGPRSEVDDAESWDCRGHLTFACCFNMFILPPTLAWWDQFLHVHMPSILLGDVCHWCLDILHIQPRFFIQQSAFGACPRSYSSILIDLVGVYTEAYPMYCHVCAFRLMMVFGDVFS